MKGEEEEEIPPACLSPPLLLHFFVVSRPPKEEEEARDRDRECSGRRRKGIRGHTESGEEEGERVEEASANRDEPFSPPSLFTSLSSVFHSSLRPLGSRSPENRSSLLFSPPL